MTPPNTLFTIPSSVPSSYISHPAILASSKPINSTVVPTSHTTSLFHFIHHIPLLNPPLNLAHYVFSPPLPPHTLPSALPTISITTALIQNSHTRPPPTSPQSEHLHPPGLQYILDMTQTLQHILHIRNPNLASPLPPFDTYLSTQLSLTHNRPPDTQYHHLQPPSHHLRCTRQDIAQSHPHKSLAN